MLTGGQALLTFTQFESGLDNCQCQPSPHQRRRGYCHKTPRPKLTETSSGCSEGPVGIEQGLASPAVAEPDRPADVPLLPFHISIKPSSSRPGIQVLSGRRELHRPPSVLGDAEEVAAVIDAAKFGFGIR